MLGAGGGVGLAAVDIGRALGARVHRGGLVAGEAGRVATRLGADGRRRLQHRRPARRLDDASPTATGVDVVYDPVGGPLSEQALRSTAWGGRFLVIGFAAGEIPKIPLNLALLKGCSIVGVFLGRARRATRRQRRRACWS